VYWVNWFIVFFILNLMQTMVLLISGYVFNFDLWKNCPFSLLFYSFFWCGLEFMMMGCVVSTFMRTTEQSNKFAYSLILLNLIVGYLFTDTDFTYKLFYSRLTN